MAAFRRGVAILLLLSNLPAWALLNSPVWEGAWNIPDAQMTLVGAEVNPEQDRV